MIRTRFAPSPTGYLHIGGLRTALYAYFFAKQNGGKMILRIEDTDKEREVHGAIESLVNTLRFMDVQYDEGVMVEADGKTIREEGDHGPYIQSHRIDLYREHVDQLISMGHAYRCFCTRERLEEMREIQLRSKLPLKYDRFCLGLNTEEVERRLERNEPHTIRLHVPEGETQVEDTVYGHLVFNNRDIDDQVLLKSDGFPTYHLAVVVDDHHMKISHVIRGEDWLSSTPKHVMLYQMFGWQAPVFAHLPNLLNPDKKKLSKRQGDVAVEDFLNKGYLPNALNNFVATLGFNPKGDQEIYSMEELITLFDLTKVNRAGAVVNYEKLDWMNSQYLRAMDVSTLASLVKPILAVSHLEVDSEFLKRIITIERERAVVLNDLAMHVPGYLKIPDYDPTILVWKKADAVDAKTQLEALSGLIDTLSDTDFENVASIEACVKTYIAKEALSTGNVLWPMRVALSGVKDSPSPFELAWVFGKLETQRRLSHAISRLS